MTKTPVRTIRVDDELWNAARAEAEKRGMTMTDAVREALTAWLKPALVVLATVVALLGLTACGGSEPVATPSLSAAPAGERTADTSDQPVKVASDGDTCTKTGRGTEYNRRMSQIDVTLRGSANVAQWRAFKEWIEAQPDGCTPKDAKQMAANIDGANFEITYGGS